MALVQAGCPRCGSTKVMKQGKTLTGAQRYSCDNQACEVKYFQLDYKYNGCKENIDAMILNMTINGSGIRDIARVLSISTDKVISVLKNRKPS